MLTQFRPLAAAVFALLGTTTPAFAADAAGNGFAQLVPLILIMVIFYFLLIRPQQKRAKEHNTMIDSLKKGDKVVTNGGIFGQIIDVKDNFLKIEIAENVRIKVKRDAIISLDIE